MSIVAVDVAGRAYRIAIGRGFFAAGAAPELGVVAGRRVLLVSDSNVEPLYVAGATQALTAAGASAVQPVVFPAGEASKTLATMAQLYSAAVASGLDRGSVVAALGGGVTGDLAGFLAATWMRGIDCVQLPTSLLAQVDSAVGGKTGVDLPEGKNLVGAFHQPRAVVVDVQTLATLPARQLRCGLAEVVKYGVILDANFFAWIETHVEALLGLEPAACEHLIQRCCELKAQVVGADETDRSGRRAVLNYGHTFGHALERLAGYADLTHGEGVAIGMAMAAETAMAWTGDPELRELRDRQDALLERLGLPTHAAGFAPAEIIAAMRTDKKYEQGRNRLILPRRLGQAELVPDVPDDHLAAAVAGRCR